MVSNLVRKRKEIMVSRRNGGHRRRNRIAMFGLSWVWDKWRSPVYS